MNKPLKILILGFSGSGKSTSIQNLNPEETFIFNCWNKPLPFKGGRRLYTECHITDNPNGNLITTENYNLIQQAIIKIDKEKPHIKNIVIDDSQALILHEFMESHNNQNKKTDVFKVYTDIADHFYYLIYNLKFVRGDLYIFFLHHAEINDHGIIQPKSMGKLLNDKLEISSMFTIVLFAIREGENNYFLTQNDGTHPAKTPQGMFKTIKINNDLQMVIDTANSYFEGE